MKHSDDLNQDDVLLQKLTRIVLDNLENEQFSVEELSDQIGMSRSHLYRRIKLLKGQSISQFIRQIRLERAMEMLENNVATSSEIAYRVGFNSPSYFNKCFNEHFGYPPGEVRKRIVDENFHTTKISSSERPNDRVEKDSGEARQPDTGKSLKQKKLPSRILLYGFIILIALAGSWYLLAPENDEHPANSNAIAVLPLEYLKSDPEQEYLAAGLHDALIGSLGRLSGLRVISRTSTLRYRGGEHTLPEIAQELGVGAIVEGSIFGAGDSLRLQLQLIEIFPKERQLWSKDYPLDLSQILAQQNDVVRNVAREIHVTLTPREEEELASAKTVNPEAHKAYLKGLFHWQKLTEEDLNLAMEYFQLALSIDSSYALAYSGIASVWVGRMQQGLSSYFEGSSYTQIASLKVKSLALGQDLPDTHFALGAIACWVEWDFEKAEREFREGIALNPNAAQARAYFSHVLNILHKPEEAMVQIDLALKLDPFNPLFRALYGMDLNYARRYDYAIEILTKTLEKAPTDPVALSTLRTSFHMEGMYPEALEIWRTSYAARGDQEAIEVLLRGEQEGGYVTALRQLAELLIERSATTFVTPWQIATLYTRAGMKDEALEWLEKAFQAHDPNMPYIGVDPIFEIFYGDPRYQDLLKRMKLPLSPHPLASS